MPSSSRDRFSSMSSTLSPAFMVEEHLRSISPPANLRINDQIRDYREMCRRHGCDRPYHHFAFGQSPFPPPPSVTAALREGACHHGYLPTPGLPELREAVAAFHSSHFNMDVAADQVIVSPSRDNLSSSTLD